MRHRKVIGSFAACAMASSLLFGMAGAAQAFTNPDVNTWYEIYPPLFNTSAHKCLDVPSGSNTIGLHVQLYHCHGYDSSGSPQRWYFIPVAFNVYLIYNVASGRCLSDIDPDNVLQETCQGIAAEEWQMTYTPFDSNLNLIQSSFWPGSCLSAANSSGNDGTQLIVANCDYSTGYSPALADQLFALG